MTPESEEAIQARIQLCLGSRADTRIFRNHVAVGWTGQVSDLRSAIAAARVGDTKSFTILRNARRASFGLCVGSSDLIGFREITITPEMVGQKIAAFLAVEVKAEAGRPTTEQKAFIEAVRSRGGLAGIARSVEQALAIAGAVA